MGLGRGELVVFYDGSETLEDGAIRKSKALEIAWYHRHKSVMDSNTLGYR